METCNQGSGKLGDHSPWMSMGCPRELISLDVMSCLSLGHF